MADTLDITVETRILTTSERFKDPTTNLQPTYNVYHVTGIDRELTLQQVVMAVCLHRATQLESDVVGMMASMSQTTVNLESLTTMQEAIVENQSVTNYGGMLTGLEWYCVDTNGQFTGTHKTGQSITSLTGLVSALKELGLSDEKAKKITSDTTPDELVSTIGSLMDSFNTVNQTQMIDLQSYTNKRDQSYDMITNIIKSMNNTLLGTANNF